ncbi:MAG: multiheme c-type cytochrome [Desulfuromonadales bacterium]|nr:multiheme c-type cytochrome [Desulfuromonadales bacterium]
MTRLIIVLFAMMVSSVVGAADENCIPCHTKETPGAVKQWRGSAHADKVFCAGCHGEDHQAIVAGEAKVTATVCGRCHEQQLDEHQSSRHGMGLHSGWGCTRNMPRRDQRECRFCHEEGSDIPVSQVHCARFLKQSSEIGELGCNRCHLVESSCATCHTNHLTDGKIARDPAICAKCHMGPDHPQWEMWQSSLHGALNNSAGPDVGPDCQRCHMPAGTHNVSGGLTMTPGGVLYPPADAAKNRDFMVAICSECHAPAFARRELTSGDAIREQSRAIVAQAVKIVRELNDAGLLSPSPQERPAHPLRGHELVTDSQMLYEDTSHIERLLFKMQKYDFARTVKGAYHQNPAYTHWIGNAELKMDLVDIRAEAERLRLMGQWQATPTGAADIKEERETEQLLQILRGRFERGEIDQSRYEQDKKALLDSVLQ